MAVRLCCLSPVGYLALSLKGVTWVGKPWLWASSAMPTVVLRKELTACVKSSNPLLTSMSGALSFSILTGATLGASPTEAAQEWGTSWLRHRRTRVLALPKADTGRARKRRKRLSLAFRVVVSSTVFADLISVYWKEPSDLSQQHYFQARFLLNGKHTIQNRYHNSTQWYRCNVRDVSATAP